MIWNTSLQIRNIKLLVGIIKRTSTGSTVFTENEPDRHQIMNFASTKMCLKGLRKKNKSGFTVISWPESLAINQLAKDQEEYLKRCYHYATFRTTPWCDKLHKTFLNVT